MSDHALVPAVLPAIFRPVSDVPLVRLGGPNDGGYLIDSRNLDHTDILIGMGINDDWSFEEQFLQRRTVPLRAYDATVSGWDFFIRLYTKIALFEPINAMAELKICLGYRSFFDQKTRWLRKKFVGRPPEKNGISWDSILNDDIGPDHKRIYFKIDIERDEYQILDDLVACADRIEGLTIEFHDVDRNMDRITRFLNSFPLSLCHTHANNFAILLDDGTPTVIECSFTRHPGTKTDTIQLPHPLDAPCDPPYADIGITFTD